MGEPAPGWRQDREAARMARQARGVKPEAGIWCLRGGWATPPGMTTIRLSDRAVLRVDGPDARPFLQGLLTNDVDLLAPGRPLYAGLLSPQGKTLFALLLHEADGRLMIDCAAQDAAALARRLAMYRLRKAVTIEAAPELAVHASTVLLPDRGQDPRTPALGARWIAPAYHDATGDQGWRAHRLALGIAEAGELGSEELLWLETGADLLNGVSFSKGCYVGQENTARMHHRDRVRRRIVPLRLAGAPQDETVRDAAGRQVGSLRGAPEGDLVLAHLRLEALAGPLTAGGVDAAPLRPEWLAPALAEAG